MKYLVRSLAIALALTLAALGTAAAADKFVRIGTSTVGGGFYLVGNTIAQLGQQKMPGVNFTAITGGSIKNCINLEKGEIELGLTQSSTLALAMAGEESFKTPLKKLRYVSAIYPMPGHVLVGAKAGIKTIADFKGKHVDFGSVGQGIEVNVREFMSVYGVTPKEVTVERFGRAEFDEAFKTGRMQATVWTTTIPNAQVADLIRGGTVGLIAFDAPKLEELLKKYPHYISDTIPGGTYEGYPNDVLTAGAVGSLLTHADVPTELIYDITKMLHENSDFLKERLGSYFARFNLQFALAGMGTTTLHPGAEKYYREKGLIK